MSKQIAQHSPFEIEFIVKVFVWASHCIETTSANKLITFVSIDLSVASRVPLFIAFDADLLTCKAQRYFITPFCHIRSECGKNKLSNWKLHPKQDHKKRDIWLFTVKFFFSFCLVWNVVTFPGIGNCFNVQWIHPVCVWVWTVTQSQNKVGNQKYIHMQIKLPAESFTSLNLIKSHLICHLHNPLLHFIWCGGTMYLMLVKCCVCAIFSKSENAVCRLMTCAPRYAHAHTTLKSFYLFFGAGRYSLMRSLSLSLSLLTFIYANFTLRSFVFFISIIKYTVIYALNLLKLLTAE